MKFTQAPLKAVTLCNKRENVRVKVSQRLVSARIDTGRQMRP
jgi:hypothetical protein